MTQLKKADNDPNEPERVALIKELLDESETDSKAKLKKIKADKDKMKALIENMRDRLRSQNAADVKLDEINEILKDTATTMEVVEKKLKELDDIHEDIEERKKRWIDFDVESSKRADMIDDFMKLLAANEEAYKKMCEGTQNFYDWNRGFTNINSGMKDHTDYELKQGVVKQNEEKQAKLGQDANGHAKDRDGYGTTLEELKGLGDENALKALAMDQLQKALDKATTLNDNLGKSNGELDDGNGSFQADRNNMGDDDLYEIGEKKMAFIQKQDDHLQEAEKDLADLQDQIADSKEKGDDVSKVEPDVNAVTELLPKLQTELKELQAMNEEVQDMIQNEDLYKSDINFIAEIIEKLRELSKRAEKLAHEVNELMAKLKLARAKLSGMDSEKRLKDIADFVAEMRNRLKFIEQDIEKLIRLARELDGYTSDDEEAYFVENLISELESLRTNITAAQEECDSIDKEIKTLQDFIAKKKEEKADMNDEELAWMVTELTNIEERVERNDNMISEIERVVDAKKKRFEEMDMFLKFQRREKELTKLSGILEEREKVLDTLMADCQKDVEDEKAPEDLKKVCEEVLGESEMHKTGVEQCKAKCEEIKVMIDEGFKRWDVEEMSIDELFELLTHNVEIKKKLRQLLEDIDTLSKAINESRKKYMTKKGKSPPKKAYKATKGDDVDQMLGDWINKHGCVIPIKRIGNGFYMFGTKKIYAKIMNGKLVIRVGGGYMSIDEFMKHYGIQEMQKLQRMELEEEQKDEELDVEGALTAKAGKRKTVMGLHQAKAALRGARGTATTRHRQTVNYGNKSSKNRPKTAAKDLEAQLRELEKQAADGTLKEGMLNIDA